MPVGVYKRTTQARINIGLSSLGRIPWNKGKRTGLIPKTAFKKGERRSVATEFKKGIKPKRSFIKGQPAWNKGKPAIWVMGDKNKSWKGGITPINEKIRKSIEYKLWRESVFERDKYTCVFCGDNRGGNLEADHIKPFAYYPELRFAIDNGRTLCHDCHQKTDTYGYYGDARKRIMQGGGIK